MLQLIKQLLLWLRGGTSNLLLLAGVLLLISGIFAPVGTLVWWLKQEPESLGLRRGREATLPPPSKPSTNESSEPINCYIVFLPGVGDFSANQLTPGEELFLNQLVQQHPNCVAVPDVFPYSAANESLGGNRWLAPLWKFAEEADGWFKDADILIKVRNLWRFAISLDERYGPVYNQGIANAIIDRMNAAHPIPSDRQQPIKLILIGTSGGAQVALSAAQYLDQWLDAQPIVVSVGGVFSGTNGFRSVNQVYHLQGDRDSVEDISSIIFPSRWSWVVSSPFNQARRQGEYHVRDSGPHAHDGPQGYFGEDQVRPGTTYVDLTLQQVEQLPIWTSPELAVPSP